jgi:predicted small integral membrane protein
MVSWMYWTQQSAIGFGLLFGMLIFLTILDIKNPSYAKKGFLPMPTTRGDRVFISIASFFLIVLTWLKFSPDTTSWLVIVLGTINAAIVLKWG